MRIIYMGTPQIAVPALESIIDAGYEVVAAVTQPDRAKGRHKELVACPVKEAAAAHAIPVLQPEKARDEAFIEKLRLLRPDLIVVMAYGQILTKALLDVPRLGCINIHASLLPMYRGAAPISAVILNGEKETGITTMYMDEGLDTGDMLLKEKIAIDPKETTQTLEEKIAAAGGPLIVRTLRQLEAGTLTRIPQSGETSYIKMIKKEEGEINWNEDAVAIERRVRAFYPWPGTYTRINGLSLKVYAADVTDAAQIEGCAAGTVISADKCGIKVACGKGFLLVTDLQLEGKKRMNAADFLRGYKVEPGEILG